MRVDCDILVIGTGIAGLSFALKAARYANITVITKGCTHDSASSWAQGGIAAVIDPNDSLDSHIQDTLECGQGLSKPKIVEMVISQGPPMIQDLIDLGVPFSRVSNELELTREGGHQMRRIVHAGDFSGREIQKSLLQAALQSSSIHIIEHHMAIDLIKERYLEDASARVWGAYVLDEKKGRIHIYAARTTVLACGGAGKVYLYTSNPDISTGDGVAMAYRAGAKVANMELFQFHPTCLFHPKAKSFLISEALRGEGATLCLEQGKPFMKQYHPLGDLAPRDIVARAIDCEMKKNGIDHVWLDTSNLDAEFLQTRFPNLHARCLHYGVDFAKQAIPVVPAAHYMCGGICVDDCGRTELPGLFVIGETSHTGLHGANRLASNSLLEGLVYATRAAKAIEGEHSPRLPDNIEAWNPGKASVSDETVLVSHNWDELRRVMWDYVGIVRTNKRLKQAMRRIALLKEEIHDYYWAHVVTRDLLELRNIVSIAELIVQSAMLRKESRGLHYNVDHPHTQTNALDTVLVP